MAMTVYKVGKRFNSHFDLLNVFFAPSADSKLSVTWADFIAIFQYFLTNVWTCILSVLLMFDINDGFLKWRNEKM